MRSYYTEIQDILRSAHIPYTRARSGAAWALAYSVDAKVVLPRVVTVVEELALSLKDTPRVILRIPYGGLLKSVVIDGELRKFNPALRRLLSNAPEASWFLERWRWRLPVIEDLYLEVRRARAAWERGQHTAASRREDADLARNALFTENAEVYAVGVEATARRSARAVNVARLHFDSKAATAAKALAEASDEAPPEAFATLCASAQISEQDGRAQVMAARKERLT